MSSRDARFLLPNAQEAPRTRMIEALRTGMKPAVAARTFGLRRDGVWNVELGATGPP